MVAPLLHDLTTLQHGDLVAVHRSRQPVRDEDGGPPAHEFVQGVHDPSLRLGVQCGRGLVHENHPGTLEERPRERHPLLLPSAQLQTPLANLGLVPVLHGHHRVVNRRRSSRLVHLSLGDLTFAALLAVRDVVVDRVVEQHRVLGHDPDLPAQRPRLHLAGVLAPQLHRTRLHIVQAIEQPEHRALAAATRTDEGQGVTRGNLERESVEDIRSSRRFPAPVPKVHV